MTIKDIVLIALFAAITAALGLFPPIDLPFLSAKITAQSMGVMLAGALLGARRGGLALVLFVALVAAGLPLVAGGRGGLGVFFGKTGGFVLAFPLAAFVTGWLMSRLPKDPPVTSAFLALTLGSIALIYAIGIPWLSAVARISLLQAATFTLIYVPGDLIKVALTILVLRKIRRAYPDL